MLFEHDYQNYPELTNAQIADYGFSSPHKQYTEDFRALVVKVHDADTVTLRTNDRDFDFPLRFLDVDAAELSEGGEEAARWLRSKLLLKEVDVLIDSSNRVGKYGRLLGRILSGGLNVSEEMIVRGIVKKFGKKNEGVVPSFGKIVREAAV